MGFKIKTFKQILNSMVGWVSTNSKKITNFRVGSVARTLLEAVAMELESLYFQMRKGFKYAIENSIFHSFDFYRHPAIPASGDITIVFMSAINTRMVIPKGYTVSTLPNDGYSIEYEVTKDVAVEVGSNTVVVPVVCKSLGEIGNVPAYSIRIAVQPFSNLRELYNEQPFFNGRPQESKEDRKKRFTRYIDTLARGTVSAVQYGCLRVEGVAGAYVQELIGLTYVYVHDAYGNLPLSLKDKVQASLLEYRSAGVEVIVLPVVKRPIDLNIEVSLATGFDKSKYRDTVDSSVTSYLNYFAVSQPLTQAGLIKHIMTIDDNAIINCNVSLTNDVTVDKHELIRAGNISVTIL